MKKKRQTTAKSNKERFIEQMETLLLMHLILPGEQLPPERELAQQMGVSRPVIHEGLLELGARGLISIRPRHGWIVNNFTEEGALPLLSSLYRFSAPQSAARIDADLEEVRRMILTKSLMQYFSSDVAKKETNSPLIEKLNKIYTEEKKNNTGRLRPADIRQLTELDFLFYRAIIEAGGNTVFLLLFNSARELYHQKLEQFFTENTGNIQTASALKSQLIAHIADGNQQEALALLEKMTSIGAYTVLESSSGI
ncbi:FadR/GntR family transcriptional regulator [Treponema sp. OMZ 857]|uniref:FadR/GntR family transcriptional regulator n=1 Tax=Treponema sp. OMZ 857 TaxID=1643513 RepID=UPI0020A3DB26|nr:GntR family transcriptional regulator [Treponema sp. OMZ 857]UTC44138.1 FadR family transcriptional regulator [Treponema sp. OMZ 857]